MKIFYILATMMMMVGCAGTRNTVAFDTEYTVTEISGKKIEANNPTIVFAADGKIGGSTGCNRYFGSYTIDGDSITIPDNMGSTRMYCHESADTEQAFLQIMPFVTTLKQKGDTITLSTADGKKIVAVKVVAQK